MNIVTPCHGVPFVFGMRYEGQAYMQYQVVDEMYCPAADCYNTWDENGIASPYNKD